MAEARDKKALFLQNLQDAGCDPQTIEECLFLALEHRETELLRLLAKKKQCLLDTLHKNQEQIDCLDFLVYQIQRGNGM